MRTSKTQNAPDAALAPAEPDASTIRAALGLSQKQFAAMLGISEHTLRKWEQGQNGPSGAAKALLKLTAEKPDVVREVLL